MATTQPTGPGIQYPTLNPVTPQDIQAAFKMVFDNLVSLINKQQELEARIAALEAKIP